MKMKVQPLNDRILVKRVEPVIRPLGQERPMSLKTLVAMLLISVGIVAFASGGPGSRPPHVPLPPVAGALAIGVGIILFVIDVKQFAPVGARS